MTNRLIRAWNELKGAPAEIKRKNEDIIAERMASLERQIASVKPPKRKSYGGGSTLSGAWSGWNPVDNSPRDLTRSVYGATLAYLYAPPVKAAVDVIAENAASVPLVIRDADGNDIARSDENPKDSPVLMAINRSWKYHKHGVIGLVVRSHLLAGMTFLEKVTNYSGFGTDLKWLNPNAVQIQAPRGVVDSYHYMGQDRYVTYQPDEILYIKAFNPNDDVFGYSKTMNVMAEVNAAIHFGKFKAAYYNNAGQPGFAFIPEHDATDEQLRQLRDFWRSDLRGVDNFFKTLISPLQGTFTQFDPLDITKPLEMDKDTRNRILQGFGVPPEMIGDTEGNPYQFSPEKKNAFMQTVVAPTVKVAFADAMNYEGMAFLDPDGYKRGYTLAFDFSAYDTISESTIREQENTRQNFLTGGLSYNEFRRELGYTPLPEQQDFYAVPSNIVIVSSSEFGKPAALPAPQEPVVEATALLSTARNAPENTTFSSVTYNGVTVQASPVRPSDRDDKKYMRWVRYQGDERIVHWGQPGEQMERDNDEARENFNSRHQCSTKKDPFAPGFWACWAWQPSADIPGSKAAPTLDDLQAIATRYSISLGDTLNYFQEWQRVS